MFRKHRPGLGTIMLGAAVLTSSVAQANPISFYLSFDGTSFVQIGTTQDGANTTTLSGTQGNSSYTLGIYATGFPFVSGNVLQTSGIDLSTAGAGKYYIAVIETGVSTTGSTGLSIDFSNFQSSSLTPLEATATIVGGTTSILAFAQPNPGNSVTSVVSAVGLPFVYDLAELYVADFSGRGSAIAGIVVSTVPEPMSLAVVFVGLAGVSLARSRRTGT